MRTGPSSRAGVVVTLCLGALSACSRPPAEFAPPPPPEVTVATPIARTVEQTMEFAGRTRGFEEVELRARVKGFLDQKLSKGGGRVKPGEILFSIDAREYVAAVDQAKARLASANAQLTIAQLTLERAKEAMVQQAATQQEVDQKVAMRDSALADVSLAKAQVDKAQLDLDFTKIRSPIEGRLGIVTVDPGQLVGAGEATLLGTVINDSKVYVTFEIDERTVMQLRRSHNNRRPGEDGRANLPLRLQLAGETGFPHEGFYDRGDNTVDTQTGTIAIEGLFDNADGEIIPGLFVRVQAVFGTAEAMLVPDVAVLTDQLGKFVFVIGADGKAERRTVEVGRLFERLREVRSGLTATDRVVVNGTQRVRAGAPVNAKEAAAAPTTGGGT